MKKKRYDFFVLTVTIFFVGFVLYGAMGIVLALINDLSFLQAALIAVLGGYFFFSLLSGLLFTARWLSNKPLKKKVMLTIFFIVPVFLSMAGFYYSIPYGIYNFVQYKKCNEMIT